MFRATLKSVSFFSRSAIVTNPSLNRCASFVAHSSIRSGRIQTGLLDLKIDGQFEQATVIENKKNTNVHLGNGVGTLYINYKGPFNLHVNGNLIAFENSGNEEIEISNQEIIRHPLQQPRMVRLLGFTLIGAGTTLILNSLLNAKSEDNKDSIAGKKM